MNRVQVARLAGRVKRPVLAFDTEGFYDAVMEAARAFGMNSRDVARETGIYSSQLSRMKTSGISPNAAGLAALADWSGVNPARFAVDLRAGTGPAGNPLRKLSAGQATLLLSRRGAEEPADELALREAELIDAAGRLTTRGEAVVERMLRLRSDAA